MSLKCHALLGGDCCCNCDMLVELMCHPCNYKRGNGPTTTRFGYACVMLLTLESKNKKIDFKDSPHGLCEMHIRKDT